MGKTMQAIALMLSNRSPKNLAELTPHFNNRKKKTMSAASVHEPFADVMKRWDDSDRSHYVSFAVASTASTAEKLSVDFPRLPKAGTLVMVPTIALRQWQMEIIRFTKENALTVGVSR
jgi:hypothetical protein